MSKSEVTKLEDVYVKLGSSSSCRPGWVCSSFRLTPHTDTPPSRRTCWLLLLPRCRSSGLLVPLSDVLIKNYFPQSDAAVDASPFLERVPCLLLHRPAGQAEALGLACGSGPQLGMAGFPNRCFFGTVAGSVHAQRWLSVCLQKL